MTVSVPLAKVRVPTPPVPGAMAPPARVVLPVMVPLPVRAPPEMLRPAAPVTNEPSTLRTPPVWVKAPDDWENVAPLATETMPPAWLVKFALSKMVLAVTATVPALAT